VAKSEPSVNYDNKPQESSSKPFKDAKDFKSGMAGGRISM